MVLNLHIILPELLLKFYNYEQNDRKKNKTNKILTKYLKKLLLKEKNQAVK